MGNVVTSQYYWYKFPESVKASRLSKLTRSIIIGSKAQPVSKCKAMEGRYLFFFAQYILLKVMPTFIARGGRHLTRARHLVDANEYLKEWYE